MCKKMGFYALVLKFPSISRYFLGLLACEKLCFGFKKHINT